MVGDLARPRLVELVLMATEPFARPVNVEPFPPSRVRVIRALPTDEDVAVGGDQLEGITQSPPHRDVQHGHGSTRPAGGVFDAISGSRNHAVDESNPGVNKVEVVCRNHVVLHAQVLLQHLQQELGSQEMLRFGGSARRNAGP